MDKEGTDAFRERLAELRRTGVWGCLRTPSGERISPRVPDAWLRGLESAARGSKGTTATVEEMVAAMQDDSFDAEMRDEEVEATFEEVESPEEEATIYFRLGDPEPWDDPLRDDDGSGAVDE